MTKTIKVASVGAKIKQTFKKNYQKILNLLDAHPMPSFFGFLGLLLLLIIVGNFLRKPSQTSENSTPTPKKIATYAIGSSPKMNFQGRIEKSGVVKIVSATAGIVQSVNKPDGSAVSMGQWIVRLSTTAGGASMPSISRQIAEASYNQVNSNYPDQLDLINKRRDLANKQKDQAQAQRDITNQSLGDTRNLITYNEGLLSSVDTQLTALIQSNGDPTTIAQLQQTKGSLLAALNSLRQALRNAEFQGADDKQPADLARMSTDLTQKQLDLEQKALDLGKTISELNLKMAKVGESLMAPAAPCAGTVERLYVHIGQNINPGTTIASVVCKSNNATAVVAVSSQVAKTISRLEKTELTVDTDTYSLTPTYISSEPTEGSLHSVIFSLPKDIADQFADGSSVSLSIPMGGAKTTAISPFVPLDAIYQTQTDAYLYLATTENNQSVAKLRHVQLGSVYGDYVEVVSGLNDTDQVIIDRNVIDGDILLLHE